MWKTKYVQCKQVYFYLIDNLLKCLSSDTYPNISMSWPHRPTPGKIILGEHGDLPWRFSISCNPGGAWIGLRIVNFRFGGASNPPESVNEFLIPVPIIWVVVIEVLAPSMVSADLDIKTDIFCCCCWLYCSWFSFTVAGAASSSICCDALRMHLIEGLSTLSLCAELERTNCRTNFCCCWEDDDNVEVDRNCPVLVIAISGWCKKLWNLGLLLLPLIGIDWPATGGLFFNKGWGCCFFVSCKAVNWTCICCCTCCCNCCCCWWITVVMEDAMLLLDEAVDEDWKLWLCICRSDSDDLLVLLGSAVVSSSNTSPGDPIFSSCPDIFWSKFGCQGLAGIPNGYRWYFI